MAESILFFIFCIPTILGLAEIIHTIKLLLISCKDYEGKNLVIVPDNENFQKMIIRTAERMRWQGKSYAERVIILDYLLNAENKNECCLLAQKFDLEICDKEQLLDLLF